MQSVKKPVLPKTTAFPEKGKIKAQKIKGQQHEIPLTMRTPGEEGKVGGFFRNVQVPRPNIYVSAAQSADSRQHPGPRKKYQFHTDMGSIHFYLVFRAKYTQEQIEFCDGRYPCYTCQRPITGQIYFYPEYFLPQTEEPVCNIIPHCRAACAHRTVHDLPNNGDLLTNFSLMYGPDVPIAPPRWTLYVPGGYSSEEFHARIDNGMVVQEEEKNVRSFHAPVFVSCSLTKGHQLVPDAVGYIDEIQVESKRALGRSRARDNTGLVVKDLTSKKLDNTKLTQMFNIDSSSFSRTEELSKNPHMAAVSFPMTQEHDQQVCGTSDPQEPMDVCQ